MILNRLIFGILKVRIYLHLVGCIILRTEKTGSFSLVRQAVYGKQSRQKIGLEIKPEGGGSTIVFSYDTLVTHSRDILVTKLSQARNYRPSVFKWLQ